MKQCTGHRNICYFLHLERMKKNAVPLSNVGYIASSGPGVLNGYRHYSMLGRLRRRCSEPLATKHYDGISPIQFKREICNLTCEHRLSPLPPLSLLMSVPYASKLSITLKALALCRFVHMWFLPLPLSEITTHLKWGRNIKY